MSQLPPRLRVSLPWNEKRICIYVPLPKVVGSLEMQPLQQQPVVIQFNVNMYYTRIDKKTIILERMGVRWTHILTEAFSREGRDFSWVVKHNWHNWRIIIPHDLKTHFLQFWPEEVTVLPNSCKFLSSWKGAKAP